MPNQLLQQDITGTLGLNGLTDDEKIVFLSEIGDVVLESTLIRLAEDLSPDQELALEQFLDTEPEPDTLMNHLLQHHQNFEQILEEEIIAFKEEALAVLGEGSNLAESDKNSETKTE